MRWGKAFLATTGTSTMPTLMPALARSRPAFMPKTPSTLRSPTPTATTTKEPTSTLRIENTRNSRGANRPKTPKYRVGNATIRPDALADRPRLARMPSRTGPMAVSIARMFSPASRTASSTRPAPALRAVLGIACRIEHSVHIPGGRCRAQQLEMIQKSVSKGIGKPPVARRAAKIPPAAASRTSLRCEAAENLFLGLLHGFFQFPQIDVFVDHLREEFVFFFGDVVIRIFAQYGEVGIVEILARVSVLQLCDQVFGAGVLDLRFVQQTRELVWIAFSQERVEVLFLDFRVGRQRF